ncbi:thiamine biosynthesis protein ApbE [Dehalococcoides mccartyi]|uniref:FAD:protein FMN transferase n=1 Tax=Dehalococcoides mccartyi TaxID=61435 RepID=UPI00098ECECE|nr:FAD:protein FMN transferase [Dehalococcoides mccartyi]AQU06524.1 thiamine biosynthesis protein ApbE [Dehalococcoides mccartyi]AQU07964.1 thiamine biosynthesis protein ApbE [Dehalococcoides mccartyi]
MKNKLTRRDFIRISAVGAGVLAAGGLGVKELITSAAECQYSETKALLGTYITITLIDSGQDSAKAKVKDTFAEIERLSSVFNRFDITSELYRLNRSGQAIGASSEFVSVLSSARYCAELSGGAFDPTVLPALDLCQDSFAKTKLPPSSAQLAEVKYLVDYREMSIKGKDIVLGRNGMAITLDGIAKGYIVDMASSYLRGRGVSQIIVEAGGDLALQGMREDGQPWKVGITHPRAFTGYYDVIQSSNACMATSGDYENAFTPDYKYNHIIDPSTGFSPQELCSATVIARDTLLADALATAAMVMGVDETLKLLESLDGAEALLIGKDLKSYTTSGYRALSEHLST